MKITFLSATSQAYHNIIIIICFLLFSINLTSCSSSDAILDNKGDDGINDQNIDNDNNNRDGRDDNEDRDEKDPVDEEDRDEKDPVDEEDRDEKDPVDEEDRDEKDPVDEEDADNGDNGNNDNNGGNNHPNFIKEVVAISDATEAESLGAAFDDNGNYYFEKTKWRNLFITKISESSNDKAKMIFSDFKNSNKANQEFIAGIISGDPIQQAIGINKDRLTHSPPTATTGRYKYYSSAQASTDCQVNRGCNFRFGIIAFKLDTFSRMETKFLTHKNASNNIGSTTGVINYQGLAFIGLKKHATHSSNNWSDFRGYKDVPVTGSITFENSSKPKASFSMNLSADTMADFDETTNLANLDSLNDFFLSDLNITLTNFNSIAKTKAKYASFSFAEITVNNDAFISASKQATKNRRGNRLSAKFSSYASILGPNAEEVFAMALLSDFASKDNFHYDLSLVFGSKKSVAP